MLLNLFAASQNANSSDTFYYDWTLPEGEQTNDPQYPSGTLPRDKLALLVCLDGIRITADILRATTGTSGTVEVLMEKNAQPYPVGSKARQSCRFVFRGRVTVTPESKP